MGRSTDVVLSHETEDFNLEDEFGWFIDGVARYVEENPDEFIEHYGVKGMKWGVRKDRPRSTFELSSLGPDKIVRKTASGEEITMTKVPVTSMHRALARMSKTYANHYKSGATLVIRDSSGKKIGDASVQKKNDDELNLIWLGIDKSARGKGYATAVMRAAEEFGSQQGFKKLTLEVPGNAPDARHIYEKLGFRVTKEASAAERALDSTWGGLTDMEYTFGEARHQSLETYLAHYGVKGMRWGRRKQSDGSYKESDKRPKSEDHTESRTLMKKRPSEMSNTELRKLNERLQLERTYADLLTKQGNSIGRAEQQVKAMTGFGKTISDVYNLANSPAGKAAFLAAKTVLR